MKVKEQRYDIRGDEELEGAWTASHSNALQRAQALDTGSDRVLPPPVRGPA